MSRTTEPRTGPLGAIRVVEFAGLGPAPFAAMMLADLGADVLRIERLGGAAVSAGDPRLDLLNRGRPSIALDLKTTAGVELAKQLTTEADVLIEGFRPGVMERLGLGPAELAPYGSRLIYARMTGWGQEGPFASKAGHDINYVAMTGGLHMIGPASLPPPPPLNLIGDFGGGAMFVVSGIMAALVERQASGRGQVIDAAMIDGAAMLLTQIYAWKAMGFWRAKRESNLLDGAAYFYRCYKTSDGGYIAVGAIEPQFHADLLRGLGLDPAGFPAQMDPSAWPERSNRLAAIFRTRTRAEWVEAFAPFDACVTPVLSPDEAVCHPANTARGMFALDKGPPQPNPAPRFSRTPGGIGGPPGLQGDGGDAALTAWGIAAERVAALRGAGVLKAL